MASRLRERQLPRNHPKKLKLKSWEYKLTHPPIIPVPKAIRKYTAQKKVEVRKELGTGAIDFKIGICHQRYIGKHTPFYKKKSPKIRGRVLLDDYKLEKATVSHEVAHAGFALKAWENLKNKMPIEKVPIQFKKLQKTYNYRVATETVAYSFGFEEHLRGGLKKNITFSYQGLEILADSALPQKKKIETLWGICKPELTLSKIAAESGSLLGTIPNIGGRINAFAIIDVAPTSKRERATLRRFIAENPEAVGNFKGDTKYGEVVSYFKGILGKKK